MTLPVNSSEKVVVDDLKKILKKWHRNAKYLRFFHVALAVIAIIASVLVASQVTFFKENLEVVALTAAISAIATGLLGGLDLGTKSNDMMRAWRWMNWAIMKYEIKDPNMLVSDLIDSYYWAEDLIGDVNVQTKNTPQPSTSTRQ